MAKTRRGNSESLGSCEAERSLAVAHARNYNGGILSTAGNLVFHGTADGFMQVNDAIDGKAIMDIDVGTAIMAAPAT